MEGGTLINSFKRARLIAGMTQVELAKKLCVSTLTVSKWEQGLSIPAVKRLKDVADALGTTVAKLLDEPKRRNVV